LHLNPQEAQLALHLLTLSYYQFINPSTRQYFDWSRWYGYVGLAEPGQQTAYSTLLRWADGSYMRFPLALDDRNCAWSPRNVLTTVLTELC
jgi:hypothetical protein